ncbi:hypothetical protein DASC09_003000 [Saccharomycopsis crataegensis]|uniref:TLC domain-containing protein n=1 Tax=Saccharomycopsis crataegensis TaxID=43959 RepID=A0AAV5QEY3_9ASCO|nr:hypothetical protein DASC09_003000 [Saccharomycopsis crataegensis]
MSSEIGDKQSSTTMNRTPKSNQGSSGKKDNRSKLFTLLDKLQLQVSVFVFFVAGVLYWIPSTSSSVGAKFFILQGQNSPNTYLPTKDDGYFVFICIFYIIFTRIFFMNHVFKPFCIHVLKMKGQGARQRFAEQGWALVSYGSSFLWGFKLFYHSPFFNNLDNLYAGYPEQHTMDWEWKTYYLVALANWTAQIFILHVEKKRKDHYEMFAHHIITILLVWGSYVKTFIRIGVFIHMIMDFVDIWLSLAKVLRYCGFSNACDFTFFIFFFSWIALRHGLYNYLLYFTMSRIYDLIGFDACADRPEDPKCQNLEFSISSLVTLLCGLQVIMMFWMFMILKVLYKIMMGANAEDVRSDSEDDDEVEGKQNHKEQQQEEKGNNNEKEEEKEDNEMNNTDSEIDEKSALLKNTENQTAH